MDGHDLIKRCIVASKKEGLSVQDSENDNVITVRDEKIGKILYFMMDYMILRTSANNNAF